MKTTLKVLNTLKQEGLIADYAIGGAIASFFYIEPSLTNDMDVFMGVRAQLTKQVSKLFQCFIRLQGVVSGYGLLGMLARILRRCRFHSPSFRQMDQNCCWLQKPVRCNGYKLLAVSRTRWLKIVAARLPTAGSEIGNGIYCCRRLPHDSA